MALFDTLKTILTPYAEKINKHTTDISILSEDVKNVHTDLNESVNSLNGSLGTLSAFMNTVPTDTASGAVATFADGADDIPVKNLTVYIEPIQSGTGDPSPDNIRPISGWTGVNLTCNNETINIDWTDEAGEVFGGTLDATTGELTVDRIGFDGGDIDWNKVDDYNFGNFCSTNLNPLPKYSASVPTVFSSIYRSSATSSGTSGDAYAWIRSVSIGMRRIYVRDTSKANMTAEEFKTSLIGVDFVYVLDTPVTYQLTPQEVKTILGENNIFADTGDVSVEYRVDIKKYIDKVIATAISALS